MESSYGAVTKQMMESSYGAVTKQIMESSYGAVTKQIMESSYGAVTKQIMESCYGAVTSLVYRYAVIGFRFGFLTSKKPVHVPYRIKQYTRSWNHDFNNISSSCLAGKNHALPQHLPNPVHFLSIRRLYFHSNAKLWSRVMEQ